MKKLSLRLLIAAFIIAGTFFLIEIFLLQKRVYEFPQFINAALPFSLFYHIHEPTNRTIANISEEVFLTFDFNETRYPDSLPSVLKLGDPAFDLQYPFDFKKRTISNYIMPAPKMIQFEQPSRFLEISGFKVNIRSGNFPHVQKAVDRFINRIKKLTKLSTVSNTKDSIPLEINCKTELSIPFLGMDERYSLSIDEKSIQLTSKTSVGIIRGLETIAQLVIVKKKLNRSFLPVVKIEDEPKYRWRGLLIDPARRFYDIESVKIHLDAMSILKMNVLHIHLTDDQGKILKRKGIRVIPEIDMPGHSAAMIISYPEVGSFASKNLTHVTQFGIGHHQLDVSNEMTFELVEDILKEVSELFPDEYVHIGGDEIVREVWENDINVFNFSVEHNLDFDLNDVQLYFEKRVLKMVEKLGKKAVAWHDVLYHRYNITKDEIVTHTWISSTPEEAIFLGFNFLLSSDYYLDKTLQSCQYWAGRFPPVPEKKKHIALGGEACAWSEYMNQQNHHMKIYPNLAVIAEHFWSHEPELDSSRGNEREYMYILLSEMWTRLDIVNLYLADADIGLRHREISEQMIREIAGNKSATPLLVMANVLSTVNRVGTGRVDVNSKLNNFIDALYPESITTRKFERIVNELYVKDFSGGKYKEKLKEDIKRYFHEWITAASLIENDVRDKEWIKQNEKYQLLQFSPMLREMVECALAAVDEMQKEDPKIGKICSYAASVYCEIVYERTHLAICETLKRIIRHKVDRPYVNKICRVSPHQSLVYPWQ